MTANDSLAGAARSRTEPELAMQRLEHASAGPSGQPAWIDEITTQARQVQLALNHHIVEVEAPASLLDDIVEQAPRLQRRVEGTKEHHIALVDLVEGLLDMLAATGDGSPAPVADIRARIVELLTELTRHRQDGADLIFEAYDVDIGGF